jgi:hypothetical protein
MGSGRSEHGGAAPMVRAVPASGRRSIIRVIVGVVFVALVATGCRVRTEVGIDVREDGSGTVTVAVGLDADALAKAPDLQQLLRVDDLRATGWTVAAPVKDADGYTTVRASKPFANPAEAADVLSEVSGPTGPFRDFRLSRTRSFARTTIRFHGTVDLSGGLAAFADGDLAQQLGGRPLGDDLKAIEQRAGDSLNNVFEFQVAARLPGDVTSNASGHAGDTELWQPRLSDPAPVSLDATGRTWRRATVLLVVAAAVAAVLLVLVLLRRLVRRTRKHRSAA